jgi:hypothetical protein
MPQTAIIKSVPAPVGGVNARDALAAMPETDCVIADNFFGTPSFVAIRNGSQSWATGLPGAVETVMAYNGLTGNKLFGVSGNALYDVTVQGAVGAAIVSSLINNRFQHQLFNAGGGTVLIGVNGAAAPLRYDGGAQGGVVSFNTLVGGSGYTGTGTYTAVPLTGGAGTAAKATIVVAGGVVTSVIITTAGTGYVVGNTLSASNSNLGGAGSGFSITVETVGGWSVTTINGTNTLTGNALVPTTLITATVFQQRMWYIENNTMNVWYTVQQAYQGVVTLLPLGSIFKLGGFLMQMATWTIDNVSGINDYAVFITSEGEVAVYQGYDPNFQSTWSLVGVFRIGRPIGRRCYTKVGSDVLIITADGLAPLSKAMLTDRDQPDSNLTYKIVNALNNDVQAFNQNFGWQVIEYPLGNKLILNVPEIPNNTAHQWVMNSVTKNWWRFKAWNANCWELQQDALYYGGNTAIYLADTGTSDAGTAITWDCKPAFSYFDKPGQLKQFKMCRPIFLTSAQIQPRITLNIDFNDVPNLSVPFTAAAGSPWNTSAWNTTPWGGSTPSITVKNWIGIGGLGYAASGRLTGQTKGIVVQWFSTDYAFDVGGPI